MFTGFSTENTPAIQVWDFSGSGSTAVPAIALTEDCAPIQFFKTGGSANTNIRVILPPVAAEGRIIKIINARFSANSQKLSVFSVNARFPTTAIHILGQGQTLDLCYSAQFLSSGNSIGPNPSSWISLNQSPSTAANFASFSTGNNNCNVQGQQSSSISGNNNSVTGDNSVSLGGNGVNVSGNNAAGLGGQSNTISGSLCAGVGGSNNSVSGTSSVCVGGQNGQASSVSAVVAGSDNIASGAYSVVSGGEFNTASSQDSTVLNGQQNIANSGWSAVVGGIYGRSRSIQGNFVIPASVNPVSFAAGVQQSARLLLGRQTTDATPTVITSDVNAASTTNQVILPNSSAYTFQGTVIANVTGGGNTSSWKFEGAIKRGANAASTILVAAVIPTVIAQDAGAAAWVVAVTADTTNGGLQVTVTGAAATTIRWVCVINTTEVTY